MKKSVVLLAFIIHSGLIIKAQPYTNLCDSIEMVRLAKKNIVHFVIRQEQMQKNRIAMTYLIDSSLMSKWDSASNAWSAGIYSRTIYSYDTIFGSVTFKNYLWRSLTHEWINHSETRVIYNSSGDMTDYSYDEYDTITDLWVPKEHDVLVYNNSGILLNESWNFYIKSYNIWFTGYLWKYNETGGLTEHFYNYWNYYPFEIWGGSRMTYSLNSWNKPTVAVHQDWDNGWTTSNQVLLEYTDDTLLVKETFYWKVGSDWILDGHNIYTYSGNLLAEVIFQTWNSETSSWKNFGRTVYSYDSENLLSEELIQFWGNNSWSSYGSERTVYTYDNDRHNISRLNQQWFSSAWANYSLNSYVYNNEGLLTFQGNQAFDLSTGLVQTGHADTYTYDFNDLNIQFISANWNTSSNDWLNSSITYNYFSSHKTTLGLNSPSAVNVRIFPNPATNELRVINIPPHASIIVSDLKGRAIIIHFSVSTMESIDISNLSRGVYLLKVNAPGMTGTSRFVKL